MGIFDFFTLNKGEKKIKKWKSEHHQLFQLIIKIQDEHLQGHTNKSKKYLKKMYDVTVKHVQDEDRTFDDIKKHSKDIDKNIVEEIEIFESTFIDIKKALIHFLLTYREDDRMLDKEFEKELDGIQKVLSERIKWEESNLYNLLENKI